MKILLFIIALLTAGIVLTVSLPKYTVNSSNQNLAKYEINRGSLTVPLKVRDFLLVTPRPPETQYALRLGLFSQLQQATRAAETLQLPTSPTIVKAIDTTWEWYLLTLGPFTSQNQAEQQRQWLQNNQISATLILWPNHGSPSGG